LLTVDWCGQSGSAKELASFFAEQVTTSYVSHSELQLGRAKTQSEWAPNLKAILEEEISSRLKDPSDLGRRVVVARENGVLVGLAYVTFNLEAPTPFAVLEDIVVSNERRGSGLGQAMLDWIFKAAKEAGAKRIFLESGKNNHDAHHFFERNGFHQISIVMMAELNSAMFGT
jgi:ribosomal protein S18 acetylase RimI-like enzyme